MNGLSQNLPDDLVLEIFTWTRELWVLGRKISASLQKRLPAECTDPYLLDCLVCEHYWRDDRCFSLRDFYRPLPKQTTVDDDEEGPITLELTSNRLEWVHAYSIRKKCVTAERKAFTNGNGVIGIKIQRLYNEIVFTLDYWQNNRHGAAGVLVKCECDEEPGGSFKRTGESRGSAELALGHMETLFRV